MFGESSVDLDRRNFTLTYLYVKQDIFDADHVLELVGVEALHFDHLVVARAVVEEVGALGEVRHHL